jgi:hypothetical protein
MARRFLLCAGFLVLGSGCASLNYTPSAQSVGEYRDTAPASERARAMANDDAANVRVFVDSFPDGIAPGPIAPIPEPSRYELLGKVIAEYKDPTLVDLGVWFYSYKEGERWRHGLCDWQVPLSWVTFTLWAAVSPSFIPCRVGIGTLDERRNDIVQSLRKAAKALGGDVVVVENLESQIRLTSQRSTTYLFATGYAFRSLHSGGG